MFVILVIGFLFYGVVVWVLYKGCKVSINVYVVFLYLFFDLIFIVFIFFVGILIYLIGWFEIDIILSMLIVFFVLFMGVKVIICCIKGFMENKSKFLDVLEIE